MHTFLIVITGRDAINIGGNITLQRLPKTQERSQGNVMSTPVKFFQLLIKFYGDFFTSQLNLKLYFI